MSAPYTERWLAGPRSTQFYTRFYPTPASPPKALLVFVHGFVEHVARYTAVHTQLASSGIAVFTFDQRGFGRTALDEEGGKGRTYGQTSWAAQFEDIEWAVGCGREEVGEGVPVFLMGHSMGGGLALGYPTRLNSKSEVLRGVIATSPLILLTKPPSKLARWLGGKASIVLPNLRIPANTKPEDLSHDQAVNDAYAKDPLIKQIGTLRGVNDMLGGGEQLLKADYQNWRASLPLLLVHGTADKVTSAKASQEFYEKVPAKDKEMNQIADGYHELHNEPDGVKERLIEECILWIETKSKM